MWKTTSEAECGGKARQIGGSVPSGLGSADYAGVTCLDRALVTHTQPFLPVDSSGDSGEGHISPSDLAGAKDIGTGGNPENLPISLCTQPPLSFLEFRQIIFGVFRVDSERQTVGAEALPDSSDHHVP